MTVEGTAADADGKVQYVKWRLDDGEDQVTTPTGESSSTWSFSVAIDSPGAHTVTVWATDMVGYASEEEVREVRVQEIA